MAEWNERVLPLLEAIYAGEEAGNDDYSTADAASAAGVEARAAERTMLTLYEAGFVTGFEGTAADRRGHYGGLRLTEKGRRAVGQWPPGPAEALVAALDRQIASEEDPEERSKLIRFRDAAASFVRDVGTQAAGSLVGGAAAGFL